MMKKFIFSNYYYVFLLFLPFIHYLISIYYFKETSIISSRSSSCSCSYSSIYNENENENDNDNDNRSYYSYIFHQFSSLSGWLLWQICSIIFYWRIVVQERQAKQLLRKLKFSNKENLDWDKNSNLLYSSSSANPSSKIMHLSSPKLLDNTNTNNRNPHSKMSSSISSSISSSPSSSSSPLKNSFSTASPKMGRKRLGSIKSAGDGKPDDAADSIASSMSSFNDSSLLIEKKIDPEMENLKSIMLSQIESAPSFNSDDLQNDQRFLNDNSNRFYSSWSCIVDDSPTIQVFQNMDDENCFKVIAELPNSSSTSFDLFYDICDRPFWDDMCEKAEIIQEIDLWTRIIYIQMKPVWPTTPRDLVILSYIEDLGNGKYLNIAKSIDHSLRPETQGFVRMKARCVGQLILPLAPNRCKIIQIADGDPGGWIPKSVIRFVSTKAIPFAFKKISEHIMADPVRAASIVFDKIQQKLSLLQNNMENAPPLLTGLETPFEGRLLKEIQNMQQRMDKLESQLVNLIKEIKKGGVSTSSDYLYSSSSASSSSSLIRRSLFRTQMAFHSVSPIIITGYFLYHAFQTLSRKVTTS